MSGTRLVEVRQRALNKNDIAARELRKRFENANVTVTSLGSGKTAFLERILSELRPVHRVAALVGDLATDNDAIRLARCKVPVKQICTGTICHLDAFMVAHSLEDWNLDELDFLFIENVGNLVCLSSYDLGENARMVLLSVTEGEDKPLKYPTIFNSADVAVIIKCDLAAFVEFSWEAVQRNIQSVRPRMRVFQVSAKSGEGLAEVIAWMEQVKSAATSTRPV